MKDGIYKNSCIGPIHRVTIDCILSDLVKNSFLIYLLYESQTTQKQNIKINNKIS